MARERVLGLPIGKRKRPRYQLAKTAGTAAAILAPVVAVPVARKAAPAAQKLVRTARRAESVVETGSDIASKASDVMGTASSIKESVSSHSSTIGKVGGLISGIAKAKGGGQSKPKLSHLIEQHTDIAAPRSVVYNQWTQFEMFPTLTKGIESASQEEDNKVKWTAKIGPSRRTWTGEIVEQIPDERIAWKSEGGASLQGAVTFHSLADDLTRVLLQMEYKPSGAVEWTGNTLRVQRRRAKRDLRLFKHFVEMRGEETGAWRGRISEDEPLEPQFAGRGKVDRNESGKSSRRSSSASRSRATSAAARKANGAQRNGRRASSSGSSGASRNGRRTSSGAANGAQRNGRRTTSSGSNNASRNGRRASSGRASASSSSGRTRRTA
jgi:uncharacterized membrane protein